MRWIAFPDKSLTVNGLPFFPENAPRLWRLPQRVQDIVRPPVWELARHCSGGRIRFATDSSSLDIRLTYDEPIRMKNMPLIGQTGVDCCVDGQFWAVICPDEAGPYTASFFNDVPRQRREICLYLPLYSDVQVRAIGVDDDAKLWAPAPFALPAPVVFYGSSITQGGCASRPGLSYEAILGRALNIDFVNLGFSGNGMGETEIAEIVASIEASCYVCDFAQNVPTVEGLRDVYLPFIETIRARHPNAPILCITPIHANTEFRVAAAAERLEGQRDVVTDAVRARFDAGDERITRIIGTDLIGPDSSYAFVDDVHPNDIGFMQMAERLRHPIAAVLGIH